jgi:Protein of unknown function (DUF3592)
MAGIFLFDGIGAWFRRRGLQRRLELAKSWPITSGEILSWSIIDCDTDAVSAGTPHQIEAKYYFTLNGEYFGGHVRSIPMTHSAASRIPQTTPKIQIRYDSANPDNAVVLVEDNQGNLPFQIVSS